MWEQVLRVNVSPPKIPILIWKDSKFPLNALDEVELYLNLKRPGDLNHIEGVRADI